jgi:hypothetical protein
MNCHDAVIMWSSVVLFALAFAVLGLLLGFAAVYDTNRWGQMDNTKIEKTSLPICHKATSLQVLLLINKADRKKRACLLEFLTLLVYLPKVLVLLLGALQPVRSPLQRWRLLILQNHNCRTLLRLHDPSSSPLELLVLQHMQQQAW